MFSYRVNPPVTNDALNDLFNISWPAHETCDFERILRHSLFYVCAYPADSQVDRLIGYVNVAWDGGVHAFILDTTVHPDYRKRGIGLGLVQTAVATARTKNIQWVHVDYEAHLSHFYETCGFSHTDAGLIHLK